MGYFVGAVISCDQGVCPNKLWGEKLSTFATWAINQGWKREKGPGFDDDRWYCPTCHQKREAEREAVKT